MTDREKLLAAVEPCECCGDTGWIGGTDWRDGATGCDACNGVERQYRAALREVIAKFEPGEEPRQCDYPHYEESGEYDEVRGAWQTRTALYALLAEQLGVAGEQHRAKEASDVR